MKKSTLTDCLIVLFFLAGAFSMLFMSLHYFQIDVTGVMKGKEVATQIWYGLSLRGHIAFGILAIFLGPFQFMGSIRKNRIVLHRRLGYLYSFSVLLSGILGLIVAQFSMGGIISRLGFSALAIFWLFSLIKSINSIRNQRVQQHRKWMFINYGLTFAAIPQRTFLSLTLIMDVDFMDIYRLSAWLPWILNTMIAMVLYQQVVKRERAIN